jgi:isopenicillin N synthase-like dioxygenase
MSPIPFSVPTIDIAPYLSDPTSPESSDIVSVIKNACTTTGFFQLIGHGIPTSLQDAVFKGAEELFNLPMEEKVKLDRGESVGASNRGYELIGGQGLQEGTLPDLKEVSFLCPRCQIMTDISQGILRWTTYSSRGSSDPSQCFSHGTQSLAFI